MKRTVISLLMMGAVCLSGTSLVHAQTAVERGLKSINRASAEAIVGFLADDELQGREAGMHGSRVAARYLAANLKEADIRPLYGDSYFQPFEAYAKERQQKGARWQVHPDSITRLKQGTHRVLRMANVLGIIPGQRTDEYVIVGAHFDHLGIDETLHLQRGGRQRFGCIGRVADSPRFPSQRTEAVAQRHHRLLGR